MSLFCVNHTSQAVYPTFGCNIYCCDFHCLCLIASAAMTDERIILFCIVIVKVSKGRLSSSVAVCVCLWGGGGGGGETAG